MGSDGIGRNFVKGREYMGFGFVRITFVLKILLVKLSITIRASRCKRCVCALGLPLPRATCDGLEDRALSRRDAELP